MFIKFLSGLSIWCQISQLIGCTSEIPPDQGMVHDFLAQFGHVHSSGEAVDDLSAWFHDEGIRNIARPLRIYRFDQGIFVFTRKEVIGRKGRLF